MQIFVNAEKEKERIARESAAAVQQCLQDRARILEQLPGFWGVALRQSLARDYITEDDDKLLEHLVSVRLLLQSEIHREIMASFHKPVSVQVDVENEENEVESVMHITLRFAEDNPYLESTELTRIVPASYESHTHAQVSPVTWKPGQVRDLL